MAEVDEAKLSVTQLEADPRGTLRLNAPSAFGRAHIAPMLPDFLSTYPNVEIDLSMTDAFIDPVEEGVDLVIRVGELKDSSLIARKLAPNRRVICASPDYFARHGRPVAPDDLRHHNCLIYKRANDQVIWHLRDQDGTTHDIPVAGDFRTNNTEALRTVLLGALGIAILPTWFIGHDVRAGRLEIAFERYTVSPTALDTNIYAIFPYNRYLSPKVRAFVDALLDRFSPTPPWDEVCGSR